MAARFQRAGMPKNVPDRHVENVSPLVFATAYQAMSALKKDFAYALELLLTHPAKSTATARTSS
jgi:hypothetical protein